MARFINDESEAAGLIFTGRHKKLSHFAECAVAVELGKTFDKAWMVARRDGGYHDPIGSVVGQFAGMADLHCAFGDIADVL